MISFASAFSGIGTVEHVLGDAVDPMYAVESDPHVAEWHVRNHRFTSVHIGDATILPSNHFKFIDWWHVSPVCKRFSAARCKTVTDSEADLDVRSSRWIVNIILKSRPRIITLEQVPRYFHSCHWDRIAHALKMQKYTYDLQMVDEADLGGAVRRKRGIVRARCDGVLLPRSPQQRIATGWVKALGDGGPLYMQKASAIPTFILDRLAKMKVDVYDGRAWMIMGGSAARGRIPCAPGEEPAPFFKASPRELGRCLIHGELVRLDARMMARIMGYSDALLLPDVHGTTANTARLAKQMIGNGVGAATIRACLLPLVGR